MTNEYTPLEWGHTELVVFLVLKIGKYAHYALCTDPCALHYALYYALLPMHYELSFSRLYRKRFMLRLGVFSNSES